MHSEVLKSGKRHVPNPIFGMKDTYAMKNRLIRYQWILKLKYMPFHKFTDMRLFP